MAAQLPGAGRELLALMQLDGQAQVELKGHAPMPLAVALERHLEIARVTPQQLEVFSQCPERCATCCRTKPIEDWLWGRQLADVLREYPQRLPLATWLTLLKPLQPRLYSISSSLAAHLGRCT
jgi:sulfite reductase alpha subunit-like flavoprotein